MTNAVPRLVAIGDVHGSSLALAALIEAIRPGPEDTLVTVGDYIDFGLDSRGVLDLLIALESQCRLVPLLGNHEEMALAARSDPEAVEAWLGCGGQATLDSYGSGGGLEMIPLEHWRFLEGCRDYFETEGHIFVHANYLPHLPMDRQPKQFLRWEHLAPLWTKAHCSGKVVVVGHTPQTSGEILDLGYLKCIDTDCSRGGWLTALEVHSGQLWQADERGRLRG